MNSVSLSKRDIQPGTFNTGLEPENIFENVLAKQGLKYERDSRFFKNKGIWGFCPDFLIDNRIIVEIKSQGRTGNAHERAYKAYMPGLVSVAKEALGSSEWNMYTIFTGEMLHSNYIVKQIAQNFEPSKVFMWGGEEEQAEVIIKTILKTLDTD